MSAERQLPDVRIRRATPDDVDELSRLVVELGHAISADQIRSHWDRWEREGGECFVAVDDRPFLLGAILISVTVMLHRPAPVGRITTLIVDGRVRGAGLGRALVGVAEARLKERDAAMIEVTSNMRREDAHAFYERLGYERTSYRFAKH